MSAKIYALTHWVNDYCQKQADFLHLPVRYHDGFYTIGDYDIDFEQEWFVSCLLHTTAIPYWVYFDKESNLREQYFDCIRSLGLREMWVFSEYMCAYWSEDDNILSLDEAIGEIENALGYSCPEYTNDIDLDVGYYPIYHDTFADLFEEVDRIEALYQVKVLGLRWRLDSNNKGKVIRCLKGNRVISLNLLTGETNFED
jgi:hypothetical protein